MPAKSLTSSHVQGTGVDASGLSWNDAVLIQTTQLGQRFGRLTCLERFLVFNGLHTEVLKTSF